MYLGLIIQSVPIMNRTRNQSALRPSHKFQKEWSDVLGKTIWYTESSVAAESHHVESHHAQPSAEALQQPPVKPESTGAAQLAAQFKITKILRLKGTKKHKYYNQLIIIIKSIGYKSGFNAGPLVDYLDTIQHGKPVDDATIYKTLGTIYKSTPAVDDKYVKSSHVSRTISKFLENAGIRAVETYLDYGCGNGKTAIAVQSELRLNSKNVYGVDIVNYDPPKSLNFSIVRTDSAEPILPHSDNFFDLITAMYVFHHIADDVLIRVLSEIYRVLKPAGTLVIREHNVRPAESAEMTISLDVMHKIYSDIVNTQDTSSWDKTGLYYSKYKSTEQWDDLITSAGFVLRQPQPPFNLAIETNPVRAVVRLYSKPVEGKSAGGHRQIFRILNDSIPRSKYHRRAKDIKEVLHWGQRKLLLSEIEFLTLFYKSEAYRANPAKKIYVIYAGASPGTHIKLLAKLFPKVHFVLYDPREFDPILADHKHIKTHVQLFLDATAEEWIAQNHPKKHILFISDIRTADPHAMQSDDVEAHIRQDNEWQKNWWRIMNPAMAMFKFRLPWDDEQTSYMFGDIYLGIFAPATSTETRLIVHANAPMKQYDNRAYEEQLFRFNTHERLETYDNILFDVPSDKKGGLDNKYDSVAEIHVIQSYLSYFTKIPEAEVPRGTIIKLSKEISKALSSSRTLASDQPLKPYLKEIVKTLKDLGEIPADSPYTRPTYHKYVVGNYDRLVERGIIDPQKDEGGIAFE